MLAVLDETYPDLPAGVAYVLAAVIFAAPEADVRVALAGVPGARKRPFHWHREGPRARHALIDCMHGIGAIAFAYVHYPVSRTGLERARARLLKELVLTLVAEGAQRLVIESRGPVEDARDRATILDSLGASRATLEYDWAPKAEPLLWAADGVCGCVRQHLIDPANAPHFDRLVLTRVLDRLTYLRPRNA